MRRLHIVLMLAIFAFACSGTALAGVIFDNSTAPIANGDPIALIGPLYASFTTDANGGIISDLKLLLLLDDSQSTGTIDFALYSDASTSPGAKIADLGSLNDSSFSEPAELFDIPLTGVPAADLEISPDTRYWIGLNADPDNPTAAGWAYSLDMSGIGVSAEFYDNSLPDGVTADTEDGGYQMLVATTPEPNTLATVCVGICLIIVGLVPFRKFRGPSHADRAAHM